MERELRRFGEGAAEHEQERHKVERAFTDDSAVNILLKVMAAEPVPLRVKDPSIPPALETIVGKCLNKERHQRYATAADLAEDLGRFLNRERVLARRW